MKISIIMITYNRQNMVSQMVDSVLQQTFREFEYLIIDNGSSDGTYKVLEQYQREDERIRIKRLQESVSVGKARHVGIEESNGDYIAFVDDDDYMEEDFLSTLVSLQKAYRADYVMCGSGEIIDGKKYPQVAFDERMILNGEGAVEELIDRIHIRAGMPGKMIRRRVLERHPFNEKGKHEDVHVMYKYLADSETVVLDGAIKYWFNRHGGNLSAFTSNYRVLTPEQLAEYHEAYMLRAEWLTRRFPQKKDLWNYSVWSFRLSMCSKIKGNDLKECQKQYEEMERLILGDYERVYNNPYMKKCDVDRLEYLLGERV